MSCKSRKNRQSDLRHRSIYLFVCFICSACSNILYAIEDEERRLSESISGKLVMCFNSDPMEDLYVATRVQQLGGVGVIISKTLCDITVPVADGCPFIINVNYEVGNKLHRLLEANR